MSDVYPNEQPPTTSGPSAYEPVTGMPGTPYPGGTVPPYPGVPPYAGAVASIPGAPNPALAAILGFIPGVGAMYNGQFAKGIAHIAIFAIFESLANHVNDVFGIFVAGWIFYMAFEAYQTARARRDGLPLPDPFGLNDIGERFGLKGNPDFSSFWHPAASRSGGRPPVSETSHVDPMTGAVHYTRTDAGGGQATYQVDPAGGVHASGFGPGSVPGYVPPVPPPGYPPYAAPTAPYGTTAYGGPVYGVPPAPVAVPPVGPVNRSGLPVGALWLIGLGVLALLGSLRPFRFLQGEATGGLFLIGISVLIFFRTSYRSSYYAPGTAAARWNAVRSARGAGVVFVVGLLTLLQGLNIIYWSSSWPFLLIFFGVALLVERFAANSVAAAAYSAPGFPGQPAVPTAEPPVETASPTSIAPKGTPRPITEDTNHEGGH